MHSQHIHSLSASQVCRQSDREFEQSYTSFSSCSATKCKMPCNVCSTILNSCQPPALNVIPGKLDSSVNATAESHLVIEVSFYSRFQLIAGRMYAGQYHSRSLTLQNIDEVSCDITLYRGILRCHNVIYSISLWHQMLPQWRI